MRVPLQNEGCPNRAAIDLLVASLGTQGVVRPSSRCGNRRRVLLWHEVGCDAGADGTATSRLPIV
jgi:hypothetical protein